MKVLLNVCRCCLSDQCCKDMGSEYFWQGSRENYSEMLTETFNLAMDNEGEINNVICEDCIFKLRAAAMFRKQVVESEKHIREHLKIAHEDLELPPNLSPKQEVEDPERIDDNDYNLDDNVEWQNNDDFLLIKVKGMEESGGKSRHSTRRKLKHQKHTEVISVNSALKEAKSLQVLAETIQNTRDLIRNSNMCLFTIRNFKYGCVFCREKFLQMADLRSHAQSHQLNERDKKINLFRGGFFKNVDISDLACHLCSDSCQDIPGLQQHLTDKHNLKFKGTSNYLTPYRLRDNSFKCVVCGREHNKYRMLSIHMHSHYSNFVCETCGASFICRKSLNSHVKGHRHKKCSACPATFQSNYERTKHMKKVHLIGVNPKRHCLLCGKTFNYSYKLDEHMILEHGAKRDISLCRVCNREFPNKVNLSVHMRSVHLRERNHECTKCEMRFFTKHDLRRHETSHGEVKSFACSYCESRFKTKDSWRRHLKKQHAQ